MYFEPGKQGRRTGITLKDTGVRDEYGLEPVSGIFSSPIPTPQRSSQRKRGNASVEVENAAATQTTETLNLRKTPHLPPKTQTPRHTNIGGSPVRHSSVRPGSRHTSPQRPLSAQPDRANRKLDFTKNASNVRTSVEQSPSPFKPRPGKGRKSIFEFDDSPAKRTGDARSDSVELERTVQEAQEAIDSMIRDAPESEQIEIDTTAVQVQLSDKQNSSAYPHSPSDGPSSNQKRKRGNPRTSQIGKVESTLQPEPDQKRRKSYAREAPSEPTNIDETLAETTVNEPEETEYTTVGATAIDETHADHTEYTIANHTAYTAADPTEYTTAEPEQTIVDLTQYAATEQSELTEQSIEDTAMPDESMAETELPIESPTVTKAKKIQQSHSPQRVLSRHQSEDDDRSVEDFVPPPESDHEPEPVQEKAQPKPGKRGPPAKAASQKKKSQQPKKPVEDPGSDDSQGNKRKGPKSIVTLRAGTPQEEDGATQTRSGRTSIKPLKYWCNESFIWRHGEVDGVVRAEPLDEPKQPSRARGRPKKKSKELSSIKEDEEEADEDLLPEAWEDELGVINGRVRTWDAEVGAGNPDDEVHEDIAFASTAIATRDVQGSAFRYAKVMTMPFFGAGMVEVPPEGFKRIKNSRKMQMIFFVHEGKVTVEVGDIKFGMSKGGVWQVPRGNNYAILNESKRHVAKIFFAQGCELEAGVYDAGPSA
ncbi:hypothetical protein AAFC00_005251 [Neodothiora populina]